jgi:hypothetical protein
MGMADMAEMWYVTIQLFLSFFNFGSLPLFTISPTYSELFFDAGSDAAKIEVICKFFTETFSTG